MSKLLTAITLLANGEIKHFRRRLRTNFCNLRLKYTRSPLFIYRLMGIPFVCNTAIPDSRENYITGELDHTELYVLKNWLQGGDVFVDIGANLGQYSFAALHFLHGNGTVFAIEASPELAGNLEQSSKILGTKNLTIIQCVAGDANKEIDFYTAPLGKSTGEQSLCPDQMHSSDYVPRRLKMRTLAEITAEYPDISLPAAVKLDIEGAETMALSAAPRDWFTATGPLWIIEVYPSALARNGSSYTALIGYFKGDCFECLLLPQYALSGERLLPLRRLSAAETFSDALFYNLIAIPVAAKSSPRYKRIYPLLSAARFNPDAP